jgi:HD superfamily phosphohydrolase
VVYQYPESVKQERNKRKIINDPVYGFISLPHALVFDVIEHPYFQRLRRIKQLGMTHLVYPGALHTRFHHALGAMHLMQQALEVLRSKGHTITATEERGVLLAILLHDIGHGPYSHSLERNLVPDMSHEELSLLFMQHLRSLVGTDMDTAISIYTDTWPKHFLHRLVSGQLDMDRLDYLTRDSFFTGVSEGVISTDRIIKMLDVHNDQPAIEVKGIYSIDKFIVARRLMYWQVYLHKTVIAAEQMLISIVRRARWLALQGETIFTTTSLRPFLYDNPRKRDFDNDSQLLHTFGRLDDFDIFSSIKEWCQSSDSVLKMLSNQMVERHLFRTDLTRQPADAQKIDDLRQGIRKKTGFSDDEISYFLIAGKAINTAYDPSHENINIVFRDGTAKDYAQVSDQLNADVLSTDVTKYFVCYPKQYEYLVH